MTTPELPPLPDTAYVLAREGNGYDPEYLLNEAGYSDDQMHAYAFAAIDALAHPAPTVPEGWKLIAVKGFDDLMYWLARCERKGHLENCVDLIEPWAGFDYREIATAPQERTR